VLFLGGLFATTFQHLSHQLLGFTPEGVLLLETVAHRGQPQVYWDQVADHLRTVPGVENVALAGFPLLSGGGWNGFVSVNGAPPGPDFGYFLSVSPGWIGAMKIALLEGRDFRPDDAAPGAALVNETFVRQFLHGERAVGTSIAKGDMVCQIVGVVRDAPYRSIKEPILPTVLVPFHDGQPIGRATLVVRTASSNPMALASILRRAVPQARPEFRVSTVQTQQELVEVQTVRERLLSMLALFFASMALLLAGIGLYGVLDYSVLQRRREIGIRMAVGAQSGDIAWRVTADIFGMVVVGAVAGLALGMTLARYVASLLYQVKPTDPAMLAIPAVFILMGALLAAIPAVVHAVRIDPGMMLRQAE
jgi:predicted permease